MKYIKTFEELDTEKVYSLLKSGNYKDAMSLIRSDIEGQIQSLDLNNSIFTALNYSLDGIYYNKSIADIEHFDYTKIDTFIGELKHCFYLIVSKRSKLEFNDDEVKNLLVLNKKHLENLIKIYLDCRYYTIELKNLNKEIFNSDLTLETPEKNIKDLSELYLSTDKYLKLSKERLSNELKNLTKILSSELESLILSKYN